MKIILYVFIALILFFGGVLIGQTKVMDKWMPSQITPRDKLMTSDGGTITVEALGKYIKGH